MAYNKGNYIFASANIRTLEKTLLSESRVEKLLSCKTMQEAALSLSDLGYPKPDFQSLQEDEAVRRMLGEELSKAYGAVRGILADPHALDAFSCVYDYHNVKTLIKAEFSGKDPEPLLMDSGNIEPAQIAVMVRERKYSSMSDAMAKGVKEALETYAEIKDPQRIDTALDCACFEDMAAMAKASGSSYIEGYVQLLADCTNLRTAVRLRAMEADPETLRKFYLPGGRIQFETMKHCLDETPAHFADRLTSFYGFRDVFTKSMETFEQTGEFTLLETLLDDELISYAGSAKYSSYGLEIPAAYLIAKESDIKLLRIIFAGIKQGLSQQAMKPRIRRTYV